MSGSANHDTPPAHQPEEPRKRRDWGSLAEERIQEAQRNGDFANLRGAGKPLRLGQNIYAGERALAYDLLAHNHLAPPEIERGKEIDSDLRRTESLIETLRRRRDALKIGTARATAADRRAFALVRENTLVRYTEALRGINSKILSLNITAPLALHRHLLDIEAKLRAFNNEFPRL